MDTGTASPLPAPLPWYKAWYFKFSCNNPRCSFFHTVITIRRRNLNAHFAEMPRPYCTGCGMEPERVGHSLGQ